MRTVAIAGLLAFSMTACRPKEVEAPKTIAEAPRLRASVEMADPQAAAQLVSGFHEVENKAWRWTERQFTVILATPQPMQNGAVLALKLTVPPAITNALKTITLSASIQGTELAPETYAEPGSYTYQRDIAPNLLTGESVRVSFRLDKAVPPGGGDLRELGVIVLSASLTAK